MTAPQGGTAGQVVTVFAAKGGCGKTTLAANLAVALNARGQRRVCLVDLDLVFGDVAIMLGLHAGGSLVDAVDLPGGLRPEALRSLVTSVWPDLDALLAPATPGDAAAIPAALVSELLTVLPSMYDYVVVDTAAQFSAHVLMALDCAHHHVLVTPPERPALHSLRLTLDTLDLLSYGRAARWVVLNRCDSRVGLTGSDIDAAIRTPIAGRLPSSRDLPASINRGVPLVAAQPEHGYSKAVHRFVTERLTATGQQSSGTGVSGLDELRWQW
jgi:MinD-like ATPase involved in chromosome partitioning or flagellar assembly